jgi:hypothetical protein
MGQITLVLTEEAESILRGKNNRRGDMGKYVSDLITSCAQTVESKEGKK